MMTDRNAFRCILIDPPWHESGGGKSKRGADRHYELLKTKDIAPVILGCGVFTPADDCHLYLCATNNFLADAIEVMRTLEFRFVTTITWVKPWPGLGQYFKGQTEQILFGVRGNGIGLRRDWTDRRDLTTLLKAARVVGKNGRPIHSAKPPEIYELIEEASPGPRVELFARGPARPGWTTWGREAAWCRPIPT